MTEVLPGEDVRAEDHNGLVEGLRRITYAEGPKPEKSAPFPHPWKTSVAAGSGPGKWKATVRAGYVNDAEATVAYLMVDDPRGWTAPKDYPASRVSDWVAERSWREKDQPPFLALDAEKDFVPVADAARPQAFRTEAAWEKELWAASVYLYSRPAWAFAGRILPARYRTWAGRLPARPVYPFGVRELAKIYLLKGENPEDGQAEVKQVEFWDLAAEPVEPVKLLPDYKPIGGGFGGIGFGFADMMLDGYNIAGDAITQQINAALANIAQGTSSVEFWSV